MKKKTLHKQVGKHEFKKIMKYKLLLIVLSLSIPNFGIAQTKKTATVRQDGQKTNAKEISDRAALDKKRQDKLKTDRLAEKTATRERIAKWKRDTKRATKEAQEKDAKNTIHLVPQPLSEADYSYMYSKEYQEYSKKISKYKNLGFNETKSRNMVKRDAQNKKTETAIIGAVNNIAAILFEYDEEAQNRRIKKKKERIRKRKEGVKVKEYYENGQVESIGTYKKGGGNGEFIYYYENGQVEQVGVKERGKESGKWRFYYKNGQLRGLADYYKGKQHGNTKYYHRNGQLEYSGDKTHGKETGKWENYYENGQLRVVVDYYKGKQQGTKKSYHRNGQLKYSGDKTNGKSTGTWKYYYDNGQLEAVYLWNKGKQQGTQKYYHRNGQLMFSGDKTDGKQTGKWKYYYDNGQLEFVIEYYNGKNHGTQKSYFESGKPMKVTIWEKGKLMNIISSFDNEGNPKDRGTLINGNGTVHTYGANGSLINTNTYKNGKKQK
jgi:antitoxin component YwqK of YwqJK toxin-antitoxin module